MHDSPKMLLEKYKCVSGLPEPSSGTLVVAPTMAGTTQHERTHTHREKAPPSQSQRTRGATKGNFHSAQHIQYYHASKIMQERLQLAFDVKANTLAEAEGLVEANTLAEA